MADPARRRATYADLAALPEGTRAEVIGGELHTSPAPLPRHSKAEGAIRRFVGGPYDDDDGARGAGGWWNFLEVDVELATHDIVRPDISGWRRDRLPDPGTERPIHVAPDWVCEVLSPSTASLDRGSKRELYAAHRVGHYWLVDPDARIIEVFENADGRWVLVGTYHAGQTAALPPFVEVEIPLGRLFLPSSDPGSNG